MRSFFGLPISALEVTAGAAVVAIVVGLLATLAGALYPALRAGRIPPIRALTGGAERSAPGRAAARARSGSPSSSPASRSAASSGSATSAASTSSAIVGVGSTVVMFVGMVLLAPFVVMPLIRLLAVPAGRLMPAEGRLASDSLRANPLRTSATASALVVTLSVVVVNSMMSASFVGSISDELDARFARDLTVQPLGYSEYGAAQRRHRAARCASGSPPCPRRGR